MNLWNRLMCYSRRRSPWLFHMNAGSCNGCDIETDRQPLASLRCRTTGRAAGRQPAARGYPVHHRPGHPQRRRRDQTVYAQGGPKAVVAIGSCPATTNVFIDSRTLDGPLNRHIPVDVFVPGCPPRPDAIIQGIAKAAEILAERAARSLN